MSARPDVIVVGAGVVGAACAAALAEDGLAVHVLDAGFAGCGATAEGMGHVVVMDDSDAQFALTSYSLGLLEHHRDELPADCEYDACGTLWLAENDAQMAAVEAKRAYYGERGVASELLDAAGVARAEPELVPLAGALRVPGDRVVYPPALARWLLSRAMARGARLFEGARVLEIERGRVRVTDGVREADVVINAAGIAAPALTPGLPIVPRRGHLVITDRVPGFCRHQLVELGYLTSAHGMTSESVAFNLQPRRTGQMLIGSSRELAGPDPAMNRRILRRMLERAFTFVPRLARLPAIRIWTGFRPATPDKLPLIGPAPEQAGVWIAAGHEGLGITTALGTARVLADLMAGRTPAIDAAPYSAARGGAFAESHA